MILVQSALRLIQRFARYPRAERGLLMRSFLLLLAVTIGVRLLSLVAMRRAIRRAVPAVSAQRADRPAPETLRWAVTVMSAYTPGATCLVRALALQMLLEACGWPSRLRVGFGHEASGALGGHAWVEAEGAGDAAAGRPAGYDCVLTLGG